MIAGDDSEVERERVPNITELIRRRCTRELKLVYRSLEKKTLGVSATDDKVELAESRGGRKERKVRQATL